MSWFGLMNGAHALPSLLRAADRIAALQIAPCPIGDALERMPLKALERKHLARRILEPHSAEGNKNDDQIEQGAGHYHQPARSQANRRSLKDDLPKYPAVSLGRRRYRRRMNIDL